MAPRVKVVLGLAVLFAAALVAAKVAAHRARPLGTRARVRLLEKHFAEVATDGGTLEAQLQALAVRVAALEARLDECACPLPPPACSPCTCAAGETACGHDADGDGVDDCEDACPCRPGVADNKGCPTGTPCQTDDDCQDGNPCSLDVCRDGICDHECLCLAADGFDCGPGPLRQ